MMKLASVRPHIRCMSVILHCEMKWDGDCSVVMPDQVAGGGSGVNVQCCCRVC